MFMTTKGCIPVKNAMSYIAVNTILSVLIKNVKKGKVFPNRAMAPVTVTSVPDGSE